MEHPTRRSAIIGAGLAAVLAGLATAGPASAATAAITLSPSSGPAGTAVTVTGSGFPGNTSGTVSCGGASTAVKTAKNGTFTASLTIPATAQASVSVSATVGRSSASAPFAVVAPAAVPPVSAALPAFGVAIPNGASNADLDAVAQLVGESPSIVLCYYDFQQAPPTADLDSIHARGATPLVTWEPWVAGAGATQSAYTLAQIAGGAFDSYLAQWGAALAAWGKPLMLRFAHEMNGDWYPWCEAANGNQPGDYVRAWQHVHDVVTAAGATNASWVWAPNGGGPTALAGLYPGDAYVDAVGLDAYNWGTTQTWSSWQAPDALFGPWLSQLRTVAPGKQITITETASTEIGGSKPDWNTALVPYLQSQPDVAGFVWFDMNKETDWRIDSTSASASALSSALAARR